MKERPILFTGPMVRANLRDIDPKTQTRRIMNPQPEALNGNFQGLKFVNNKWREHYRGDPPSSSFPDGVYIHPRKCPYGKPGDRLWVRETFGIGRATGWTYYRADWGDDGKTINGAPSTGFFDAWKPSIFMPRKLSRLTLEITGIRCERLQDISEEDCLAEGIEVIDSHTGIYRDYSEPRAQSTKDDPRQGLCWDQTTSYRTLWESINGPGSWDLNPLVWVVEFRRLTAADGGKAPMTASAPQKNTKNTKGIYCYEAY